MPKWFPGKEGEDEKCWDDCPPLKNAKDGKDENDESPSSKSKSSLEKEGAKSGLKFDFEKSEEGDASSQKSQKKNGNPTKSCAKIDEKIKVG